MPMLAPPTAELERVVARLEATPGASIRSAARAEGVDYERVKGALRRAERGVTSDPLLRRLLDAASGRRGPARDWTPCPTCGRICPGPAQYELLLPDGSRRVISVGRAADALERAEDLSATMRRPVYIRRLPARRAA